MFTHPRANIIEDRMIGRIDAALRQKPQKTAPDHPKSPTCCWFAAGVVTAQMAQHAEVVSTAWQAKIRRAAQ